MASEIGHLVSVVIPAWNNRVMTVECVLSVIHSGAKTETEIIVVDDGSTDDTVAFLSKHFSEIILLENRSNIGYAGSVNRGVAASRGDMIFLLNNDTKLIENTIDVLVRFLSGDSAVGAAGPLQMYADGRPQVSCRRFPTPSALILEKLGIDKIGPFRRWKYTLAEQREDCSVPLAAASALLIKRECWNAVGPFDEEFPIFFNDFDWSYRLYAETDYRIALCSATKVIHHYGASVSRMGYRKKAEFFEGLLKFYRKHFPFSQPATLSGKN